MNIIFFFFFFFPSKFHMQSNLERQPFADHLHQFKESLLISYLQKYTYKAVRKSSIDKQINSSTISSSNHFWRKSRWVPTSQTLAKIVWKLRGPASLENGAAPGAGKRLACSLPFLWSDPKVPNQSSYLQLLFKPWVQTSGRVHHSSESTFPWAQVTRTI